MIKYIFGKLALFALNKGNFGIIKAISVCVPSAMNYYDPCTGFHPVLSMIIHGVIAPVWVSSSERDALRRKEIDLIKYIAKYSPRVLEVRSGYGESSAHTAAKSKEWEILEIIAEYCPISFMFENNPNCGSDTPLEIASDNDIPLEFLKQIEKILKKKSVAFRKSKQSYSIHNSDLTLRSYGKPKKEIPLPENYKISDYLHWTG